MTPTRDLPSLPGSSEITHLPLFRRPTGVGNSRSGQQRRSLIQKSHQRSAIFTSLVTRRAFLPPVDFSGGLASASPSKRSCLLANDLPLFLLIDAHRGRSFQTNRPITAFTT